MSQIQKIDFVPTKSREARAPRQLLKAEDYKVGMTIASLIRLAKKKVPDASNGEISRFLSEFTGKHVRPQWVFNVLNTELKTK